MAIALGAMMLPNTSADALLVQDAATSIAAYGNAAVVGVTPAPDPTQPFDVESATFALRGFVMSGLFTANAGKPAPSGVGACVAEVHANGDIAFTAQQDLLIGGGVTIWPVVASGVMPFCSVYADLPSGGFVRAGAIYVTIFQFKTLTVTPSAPGRAAGDTLGTYVAAAVPGLAVQPVGCGWGNFTCAHIAGPLVG